VTPKLGLALAMVIAVATPALAEPRWLACKFNDGRGKTPTFMMMFDDRRNIAALWDGAALVDGTSTAINFQSIRTRFPPFVVIYNRNDGALAVTPVENTYGGILHGECRRSAPPPNAPASAR